jgi:hypothetical protein
LKRLEAAQQQQLHLGPLLWCVSLLLVHHATQSPAPMLIEHAQRLGQLHS